MTLASIHNDSIIKAVEIQQTRLMALKQIRSTKIAGIYWSSTIQVDAGRKPRHSINKMPFFVNNLPSHSGLPN